MIPLFFRLWTWNREENENWMMQFALFTSKMPRMIISRLSRTPRTQMNVFVTFRTSSIVGFHNNKIHPTSYILYSLKMDIGEAIKSSYQLGQKDNVTEVAELIRTEILKKFQETGEMT